jgi:hypothetical protein
VADFLPCASARSNISTIEPKSSPAGDGFELHLMTRPDEVEGFNHAHVPRRFAGAASVRTP